MGDDQIRYSKSRVLAEELPMRDMNSRKVIISMVDGAVFHGYTNIGASRRMSDYFRKSENMFIVIFDASIGNSTEKDVYFLNKDHIVWAKPDEDSSGLESEGDLALGVENGSK